MICAIPKVGFRLLQPFVQTAASVSNGMYRLLHPAG
jgi:hypothetical protein